MLSCVDIVGDVRFSANGLLSRRGGTLNAEPMRGLPNWFGASKFVAIGVLLLSVVVDAEVGEIFSFLRS